MGGINMRKIDRLVTEMAVDIANEKFSDWKTTPQQKYIRQGEDFFKIE